MSTNTTTRKTPAKRATAPKPTPAPAQAAPAPVTDAPTIDTQADKATDDAARSAAAHAYTIPAYDQDADDEARQTYVKAVGDAYQAADKSGKTGIRSAWSKFQSKALDDLDMSALALVRDVNAVLKSSRPVADQADPADAYLIRINALSRAAHLLEVNFAETYGDTAWNTLRDRLAATMTTDELAATDAMAATLAAVKLTARRTGPARSVAAHIASALVGTGGRVLTCSQIHNHRSDAYGPDESPSVGAIGAAHGRELDGIVSTTNDQGTKGFKLA
jgi:hypothetical protein